MRNRINRLRSVLEHADAIVIGAEQDKDCVVITTNVDHCFQKAGFDKKRLFYTREMERQAICINVDIGQVALPKE